MCKITIEDCEVEIKRFYLALKDGSGNPLVCQEKIDDWLDTRNRLPKAG